MGLSSLVQRYSMAELGFDPMVVPTWITVELDRNDLERRSTPAGTMISVGELVDSVSDLGFRNVLGSARRDFKVELPAELGGGKNGEASAFVVVPPTSTPIDKGLDPPSAALGPPNGSQSQGQKFIAPQEAPTPPTGEMNGPREEALQMPTMPAFPSAPSSSPPAEPSGAVAGATSEPPPFWGAPASPPPAQPKEFDPFAAPEVQQQDSPTATPMGDWRPPQLAPQSFSQSAPSVRGAHERQAQATPGGTFGAPSPRPEPKEGFSSADLLGHGSAGEPSWERPASEAVSPWAKVNEQGSAPKSLFKPPAMRDPNPGGMAARAHDTRSDQLLLRALLGSNDAELTTDRVVELTARLDGVSACVCVRGDKIVAVSSRPGDAAGEDFENQAAALAQQVKALVPLIGIDGAETFTLSAQPRTLTFCFPGTIMVGVLHNEMAASGLRDKLTLIARELDRWLA